MRQLRRAVDVGRGLRQHGAHRPLRIEGEGVERTHAALESGVGDKDASQTDTIETVRAIYGLRRVPAAAGR